MLSTTLSNDYYQFGRVYGVESDGTDYDEDIKAEAYGRFFVPPAVLAAYTNYGAGGGPYAANPGSDAIFQNVNNYPYQARHRPPGKPAGRQQNCSGRDC